MVIRVVFRVNMDFVADVDPSLAGAVLRVASQLVDGIHEGMLSRGFDDVRPVHGFVFARLSGSPGTATDVAAHLGVTKQAAAKLVAHLVERGYLERREDPSDGRAWLLQLTDKGRSCTAAADEAAADVVRSWRGQLSPEQFKQLQQALHVLAVPGRLRPAW
jgi:DNA-binding MarR family transcriptional regulator